MVKKGLQIGVRVPPEKDKIQGEAGEKGLYLVSPRQGGCPRNQHMRPPAGICRRKEPRPKESAHPEERNKPHPDGGGLAPEKETSPTPKGWGPSPKKESAHPKGVGWLSSYFAMFSQKFIRITATCARVAVPVGARMLLPMLEIRPLPTAHSRASTAQELTSDAST